MKLIDDDLLREFRESSSCEYCGKRTPGGTDPAHIFSRGAGRVDIRENLVSLCRECHTRSHAGGEPNKETLLAIAAKREKTTQDKITCRIYEIRRDMTVKVLMVS